MKKIFLMLIIFLLLSCSTNNEVIKFKLDDSHKLNVQILDDNIYKFMIDGGFHILKEGNDFVDFKFYNSKSCNSIISNEKDNIIKDLDDGFIYKDDKYNYFYTNDYNVCLVFSTISLEKIDELLDNIEVKVVKEK